MKMKKNYKDVTIILTLYKTPLNKLSNLYNYRNYKIIEYDLLPREKSQPKYNFAHSLSLGLSAITSFSLFPLRLISITGCVIFFISIILAINAFYNAIAGEVVQGWASITIPLYALGGILILSLGIVGEYIGKIFLEVKMN